VVDNGQLSIFDFDSEVEKNIKKTKTTMRNLFQAVKLDL